MSSSNGTVLMTELAEDRRRRHGTPAQTETIPTNDTMAKDSTSTPGKETHHSFTDVTTKRRAFASIGDIDSDNDHNHKYDKIEATDHSFASMGNANSDGLLKLLRQHQAGPGYGVNQNEPAS